MRIASVFWVAGCVGTFCANTNLQVVLWKLAKGVGLGLISVSSYLYIFEVLRCADRAMSVAWRVVMLVLAQECLYGVTLLLRAHMSAASAFHYAWLVEAFWGLLLIGCMLFLPQSPKVLLERGKWLIALETHAKLTHLRTFSVKLRGTVKLKETVKLRETVKLKETVKPKETVKLRECEKKANEKWASNDSWPEREQLAVDEASRAPGEAPAKMSQASMDNDKDPAMGAMEEPEMGAMKDPVIGAVKNPAMGACADTAQNPMAGWPKALLCLQLIQLLSVVVSPFLWQYLGSYCQLSTPAVEMCFHTQYALQLVFLAIPCFFLKAMRRTSALKLGLFLLCAAFTVMSVVGFIFSSASQMAPAPYLLLHTVRRFPASCILALTSFVVSVYSALIAATLPLHCAEALSPASRSRGLSMATSTAFALAALLNAFLLSLHAVRPPTVFTLVAVLSAALATCFVFASDTLASSMEEHIPYLVPPTADSSTPPTSPVHMPQSPVHMPEGPLHPPRSPLHAPRSPAENPQSFHDANRLGLPALVGLPDDPFARARDLAGSVPPGTSFTPFQPLGHTQNFIRINRRGPFQLHKPSEARTMGTLATAKSQPTAPLVTAMTRLPDDRVSLRLSRSASTSTANKEPRNDFSGLWPGPSGY